MGALRVVFSLVVWPAVLLLALASAGGAILAQLGREDLDFDTLAHFAPLWLAGGAVAFVLSFLFRRGLRWSISIFALAAVASAATLIAPEFLRDAGPAAGPNAPGQLKIVQFNAWSHNPEPGAVLRWLDAENPDIAVIEENSEAMRRAVAGHPRWHVSCRRCEVMILSRHPSLDVSAGQGRKGRERVVPLTKASFADAHGTFEVIGVHNAWPIDDDQPIQEARLAEAIDASDRHRLIVTGDFNSAPWSFARRRWDKTFGIPRRDRAIATWPARRYGPIRAALPLLPIDHVYAGPGWATVSVRRGPKLSSDHYPLIAVLAPVAPH